MQPQFVTTRSAPFPSRQAPPPTTRPSTTINPLTPPPGKHPANKASFDRSGMILAVACDDGKVKAFSTQGGDLQVGGDAVAGAVLP